MIVEGCLSGSTLATEVDVHPRMLGNSLSPMLLVLAYPSRPVGASSPNIGPRSGAQDGTGMNISSGDLSHRAAHVHVSGHARNLVVADDDGVGVSELAEQLPSPQHRTAPVSSTAQVWAPPALIWTTVPPTLTSPAALGASLSPMFWLLAYPSWPFPL